MPNTQDIQHPGRLYKVGTQSRPKVSNDFLCRRPYENKAEHRPRPPPAPKPSSPPSPPVFAKPKPRLPGASSPAFCSFSSCSGSKSSEANSRLKVRVPGEGTSVAETDSQRPCQVETGDMANLVSHLSNEYRLLIEGRT